MAMKGNNEMDNCVERDLRETNVVIGGKFLDPGGVKSKASRRRCEYERSKSPKRFKEKYADGDETPR